MTPVEQAFNAFGSDANGIAAAVREQLRSDNKEVWVARALLYGGYMYHFEGSTEREARKKALEYLETHTDKLGRALIEFIGHISAWKKGTERAMIAGHFTGETEHREVYGAWDLH